MLTIRDMALGYISYARMRLDSEKEELKKQKEEVSKLEAHIEECEKVLDDKVGEKE